MNREYKSRKQRFPVWSSVLIGSLSILCGISMIILIIIAFASGSTPNNSISTIAFAVTTIICGACLLSVYFKDKKDQSGFPASHLLIYGITFTVSAIAAIIENIVTKNSDTINTIMYTFEVISGIVCICVWFKRRQKPTHNTEINSVDPNTDEELEINNENNNEQERKENE